MFLAAKTVKCYMLLFILKCYSIDLHEYSMNISLSPKKQSGEDGFQIFDVLLTNLEPSKVLFFCHMSTRLNVSIFQDFLEHVCIKKQTHAQLVLAAS